MTQLLAPGAPVLAGNGRNRRRGGMAAVLVLDGRLHLLTCGHLFEDGESDVWSPRTGARIATLRRNYHLPAADGLDAAVCELEAEAYGMLEASNDAPTWFYAHLEPDLEHPGGTADFWPTHEVGSFPRTGLITSVDATAAVLFPSGPYQAFIELELAVIAGDSGSVLAKDASYYGICAGQVQDSWSYFTPIAAVLERLAGDYQEVAIWHPDNGILMP